MVKGTDVPAAVREFERLERSFTELANNEDWLADNFDKTVHPRDKDSDGDSPTVGNYVLYNGATMAETAGAESSRLEPTPAMIEAGALVLCDNYRVAGRISPERIAEDVFRAMAAVGPRLSPSLS